MPLALIGLNAQPKAITVASGNIVCWQAQAQVMSCHIPRMAVETLLEPNALNIGEDRDIFPNSYYWKLSAWFLISQKNSKIFYMVFGVAQIRLPFLQTPLLSTFSSRGVLNPCILISFSEYKYQYYNKSTNISYYLSRNYYLPVNILSFCIVSFNRIHIRHKYYHSHNDETKIQGPQ